MWLWTPGLLETQNSWASTAIDRSWSLEELAHPLIPLADVNCFLWGCNWFHANENQMFDKFGQSLMSREIRSYSPVLEGLTTFVPVLSISIYYLWFWFYDSHFLDAKVCVGHLFTFATSLIDLRVQLGLLISGQTLQTMNSWGSLSSPQVAKSSQKTSTWRESRRGLGRKLQDSSNFCWWEWDLMGFWWILRGLMHRPTFRLDMGGFRCIIYSERPNGYRITKWCIYG